MGELNLIDVSIEVLWATQRKLEAELESVKQERRQLLQQRTDLLLASHGFKYMDVLTANQELIEHFVNAGQGGERHYAINDHVFLMGIGRRGDCRIGKGGCSIGGVPVEIVKRMKRLRRDMECVNMPCPVCSEYMPPQDIGVHMRINHDGR